MGNSLPNNSSLSEGKIGCCIRPLTCADLEQCEVTALRLRIMHNLKQVCHYQNLLTQIIDHGFGVCSFGGGYLYLFGLWYRS